MTSRDAILIDTSVLVALARKDVRMPPGQVQRLVQREGVVCALSWGECASLVERGLVDRSQVAALAGAVRTESVADADCEAGGRLHGHLRRQGHAKVGLADCIIYATARRLGIDLLTLDGDLQDLPGVEVLGKKA